MTSPAYPLTSMIDHSGNAPLSTHRFAALIVVGLALASVSIPTTSFAQSKAVDHSSAFKESIEHYMDQAEESDGLPGRLEPGPRRKSPKPGAEGVMEDMVIDLLDEVAELRNHYVRDLETIGWDNILDMQRLRSDVGGTESRVIVGQARRLLSRYEAGVASVVDSVPSRIDATPNLTEKDRYNMKTGFRVGFGRTEDRRREMMKLEWEGLTVTQNILDLLEDRSSWDLINGDLIFADEAQVSHFNDQVARMAAISERQETLMKEGFAANRAKMGMVQ